MSSFHVALSVTLAAAALAAQSKPAVAPPAAPQLVTDYREARDDWNRAVRAASQRGDDEAVTRLRAARPRTAFIERFEAGAEHHRGTSAAVPYLVWLVQRGPLPTAEAAMTTLMAQHAADPGARLAVARIGGLKRQFGIERSRRWLDAVLAQASDPRMLAQARFTRAAMYVGTRAVQTSPELRELAIADLGEALELLGDGADGKSLRGLCERLLDEARQLEPGCAAPEIEGEDLDGVAFKLSDYRGKVVLLDFWGDW